jgi:hypothetical protein
MRRMTEGGKGIEVFKIFRADFSTGITAIELEHKFQAVTWGNTDLYGAVIWMT